MIADAYQSQEGFTEKLLNVGRWRLETNFSICPILTDFSMIKSYKIPISLRKHALEYILEAI